MCECGPVGQWVWMVKPDAPKISTKLGKNWNESKPYFSERVGLMPGGHRTAIGSLVPRPAALASITHSIGLEYGVFLRRLAGEGEHPVRALELVRQRIGERVRLVQRLLGLRGQAPNEDACRYGPVVALREAVDEDLPVALQFGLESIHLVRPGERIALDAVGQLAEEGPQRLGVVAGSG